MVVRHGCYQNVRKFPIKRKHKWLAQLVQITQELFSFTTVLFNYQSWFRINGGEVKHYAGIDPNSPIISFGDNIIQPISTTTTGVKIQFQGNLLSVRSFSNCFTILFELNLHI